jgi:hypothetical protein
MGVKGCTHFFRWIANRPGQTVGDRQDRPLSLIQAQVPEHAEGREELPVRCRPNGRN